MIASARHFTFRCAFVVCQALLFCWCVQRALAQVQPDSEAYRLLVDRALMELSHQHWSEARVLLEKAHALSPNAQTLRALGTTAYELRLYMRALSELQAALAHEIRPLSPTQRDEVALLMEQARAFVAEVEVIGISEDTQISVDGTAVTLSTHGTIALDPGDHELRVVTADGHVVRRSLRAVSGTRTVIEIVGPSAETPSTTITPRAPPPTALRAAPLPEPSDESTRTRRRRWVYALSSTAGATALTALVTGVYALRKHDTFLQCRPDCEDGIKTRGQRLQWTSLSSALVTGVFAASALGLWLRTRGPVELEVGLRGDRITGSAALRF